MKTKKVIVIAAFLGAFLAAGCAPHGSLEGENHLYGDGVQSLAVVGANSVLCDPARDMVLQPSHVYILHIPEHLFAGLDPLVPSGTSTVNCGTGNGSCEFDGGDAKPNPVPLQPPAPKPPAYPDPIKDDDNGHASATPLPPVTLNGSKLNWHTPLDVDLLPAGGPGWQPNQPMLLKIILDNPKYFFMYAKNSTSSALSPYAVVEGDEGRGMFRCPSPPRKDANSRQYITLRVFKSSAPYGGLNIGILIPTTDASGNTLMLPVYVDPITHNNG